MLLHTCLKLLLLLGYYPKQDRKPANSKGSVYVCIIFYNWIRTCRKGWKLPCCLGLISVSEMTGLPLVANALPQSNGSRRSLWISTHDGALTRQKCFHFKTWLPLQYIDFPTTFKHYQRVSPITNITVIFNSICNHTKCFIRSAVSYFVKTDETRVSML